MSQPQLHQVQCLSPAGLHSMAYKVWGDPNNPRVLICVHGVTRVSDDFDALAIALSDHYRVVCPDVVGRGRSDWLTQPEYYVLPQYVSDMVTLIARLNVTTVDWVGTSMGALIGMGVASLKGSPVRKMLMNDVGPNLNPVALKRIGEYIGQPIRFANFEQGRDYIRAISSSFGPHNDAQWDKLAKDVLRLQEDGHYGLHYDPNLALAFKDMTPERAALSEQALWAAYDAIRCPVLLLRGANSDLLTPETAKEMTQRGPCAQLIELEGIGHAPSLVNTEQITLVGKFLLDSA